MSALIEQVDEMVRFVLDQPNQDGIIECSPTAGTEGALIQAFLDKAEDNRLTVQAQVRRQWILFHAYRFP